MFTGTGQKNYTMTTGVRGRHLQSGPRVIPGLALSSDGLNYAQGDLGATGDFSEGSAQATGGVSDNSTSQGTDDNLIMPVEASHFQSGDQGSNIVQGGFSDIVKSDVPGEPDDFDLKNNDNGAERNFRHKNDDYVVQWSRNQIKEVSPNIKDIILSKVVVPSVHNIPHFSNPASQSQEHAEIDPSSHPISNNQNFQHDSLERTHIKQQDLGQFELNEESQNRGYKEPYERVPDGNYPAPLPDDFPFALGSGPVYSPYNPHYDPRYLISDPLSGFYPEDHSDHDNYKNQIRESLARMRPKQSSSQQNHQSIVSKGNPKLSYLTVPAIYIFLSEQRSFSVK